MVLFFSFSGVGRASQSASPPGHPLSRLALPDSLGSQQEAQPTATKSVKQKKTEDQKTENQKKTIHVQKLGSCIISILVETISFPVYCFFSFRGLTWPASWPVRLAIHSANSGPTGLASQLRQSARSTAHFREIRKIRKPKYQHMYRNLEAVTYPFWVTGW